MQYCSLQHWNLLSQQDTSTTGRHFCFGTISLFFLELFLHSSPVAYCGTYRPGEFIFQCHIFFPFHTVHGVLKARILKIGRDGGVEGCALIFSCRTPKLQLAAEQPLTGECSVRFSRVSRVQLFVTPWIAAHQACMSFTNSWSSLKLTSIESVMPFSHLILCHPLLLLPPIPPSIRVFSNESTLHMRWPKY